MQPRRKKVHCLGLHDSLRKYKWEITGAEILLQSYLSLLLLSGSFCAYGLLQQKNSYLYFTLRIMKVEIVTAYKKKID